MSLENTIAFITGASRGIGRSLALALSESGATVAGFARQSEALDSLAKDSNIKTWGCDVTDASIQAAIHDASKTLGPPNLVICCAGNIQSVGPLRDIAPEKWWRGIETDVLGTMLTVQAALQTMQSRVGQPGRILTVYGNLGNVGAVKNVSAFAAGKAAIASMTDNIALEVSPEKVVVMGLHPGFVQTPATEFLAYGEGAKHLEGFKANAVSNWESADSVVSFVREIALGSFDDCHGRTIHTDDFVADGLTAARRRFAQEDDYLRLRMNWKAPS